MHALGWRYHGWHPSRSIQVLSGHALDNNNCTSTAKWLAFTWWTDHKVVHLFRNLFLLWLSAMSGWPWTWCTNQYLGWLQYFFGSVYIAFGVMNAWTWDPGRPKFAHSLEFLFSGKCNKKLMTLDTHIQAQRLDKLNMFVKKTGFPKLEPLRASPINRPV